MTATHLLEQLFMKTNRHNVVLSPTSNQSLTFAAKSNSDLYDEIHYL